MMNRSTACLRSIAWARAMKPRVLLCDRIPSAIDRKYLDEALAVVDERATDGMTPVIVTHEMRFAREVGDEFVLLHHGRTQAVGPPATRTANPTTLELANLVGSSA